MSVVQRIAGENQISSEVAEMPLADMAFDMSWPCDDRGSHDRDSDTVGIASLVGNCTGHVPQTRSAQNAVIQARHRTA